MRCCVSRVPSAGCRAMGVAGAVKATSLRSRRRRELPSPAPFSEPFTERPATLQAAASPAACCCRA
uniref:Uncharacterized protein n=1 Tax=Leersia perrieri TaxID=77586 RepID=A0A0D9VJD8_9ORYZ